MKTRCSSEKRIDAFQRSDEKNGQLLKENRRKDGNVSAAGMNSTIVKMKKEDDRFKQFNERITNMEKKVLDMDEKYENRSDEPGEHMENSIKVR